MKKEADEEERQRRKIERQLERTRKQARQAEEAAIREKMRDEKLTIAKMRHEELMKKHFEKEMSKQTTVEHNEDENSVCGTDVDELLQHNPHHRILQDSDDVSDVSDISELETIIGGAHRPLQSFKDSDYLDTWTIVVPASSYKTEPRWRSFDSSTNRVQFDKFKLLHDFRLDLKRFCKLMHGYVKWNFDDFHTICFEEMTSQKMTQDQLLDFSPNSDEFALSGGKMHCHILIEYYGNNKRGTQFRYAQELERWLGTRNWHLYHSTIMDTSLRYFLKASREKQQGYLMTAMYSFH